MLYDIYIKIQLQTLMLYNAQRGWIRGIDRSPDHHQKLAASILHDDETTAVKVIREHIEHGLKNELEAIGNTGKPQ